MSAIETGVRDTLNAGIGLAKTIEETVTKTIADIEAGYKELVAKGAPEGEQLIAKVQGLVDEGVAQVKDTQAKVESYMKS